MKVGIIWSWTLTLVKLGIMETPIHGLTIYSLQMLYGSTIVQLVIFCKENLISASENLSMHTSVSFFVVNPRAYDSMFSQFVVYAFIKRNSIHTNPHICDLCPNQPFFSTIDMIIFHGTMVKMTCNHKNN